MKKTAIVALLVFFISYTKAQTYIGPTVGFGHSQITGLGGDNTFSPLISGGASLFYQTKSHVGFGGDVKFSREGNKEFFNETINDGSPNTEHDVTSNYVRVPLRISYIFYNSNHLITPKIYLGVNPGFLLHETSDFYYRSKKFDFGDIIGAGVNFKLSPTMLLNTDVAYYYGLFKSERDSYNRNLQLNIGWLIKLRGK